MVRCSLCQDGATCFIRHLKQGELMLKYNSVGQVLDEAQRQVVGV